MILLKKDTAVTIPFGPFLDDADGKTAETGLSIATADVRLSKNGGANGAKNSTTATSHNELGYYNVHLSATDTNTLGALKVMISMAGALPVWADFMVVHAKVYDALFSTGLVELVAAYDAAKTAATQASVNAIPTDISTLAKTTDLTPLAKTTDLANVAKKTDIPTDYAKKTDVPTVAQNQNGLAKTTDLSGLAKTTDLSGLATEANATANKNEIKTAIADKPVTPATNIDNLPTKTDIETAKDAIISAMPELDTSQLEGKLDGVKAKTDQLQFTAGKVNANATVDLGTSDIAKQSTSEQILAMFAEAQIAIIGNVQDGKITAIRGNDWELVIPCELPDDAKIQMAVKSNAGMRDDQSAIFLDSTTGLIYLDKDNGNAADGSLVYANGNLTLTLTAAATAKLCAGNFRYGIQSVSAAGKVVEKYQGDFIIYNDIVKATS